MKGKWGLNEWGSIASITGGFLGVLSIVITLAPEKAVEVLNLFKPKPKA